MDYELWKPCVGRLHFPTFRKFIIVHNRTTTQRQVINELQKTIKQVYSLATVGHCTNPKALFPIPHKNKGNSSVPTSPKIMTVHKTAVIIHAKFKYATASESQSSYIFIIPQYCSSGSDKNPKIDSHEMKEGGVTDQLTLIRKSMTLIHASLRGKTFCSFRALYK